MRMSALAMALVLVAPGLARADSDSLLTLGVGTGFGVSSTRTTTQVMTGDVRLRLRLLLGLGLEASYNPVAGAPEAAVVDEPAARLSGMIYIVPAKTVRGYIKAGIAADSFGQMRDGVGDTITYHAGGGLELALGEHMVLGTEFLVLVPPLHRAIETTSTTDASGKTSSNVGMSKDVFNVSNYRAVVTLMYFL